MANDDLSLDAFGASFKGFLDKVTASGPAEEPELARRFREHFEQAPTTLPVIEEKFPWSDRPNLQIALDLYLGAEGRSFDLVGVTGGQVAFMGVHIADLLSNHPSMSQSGAPGPGPVQYLNVTLAGDRTLACVQCGVYFVRDGAERLAVLVGGGREMGFGGREVRVEVMAPDRERGERFLAAIRTLMRQKNVYRGQVISLQMSQDHTIAVTFHQLPQVERDAIILPAGVLERVERSTIRFAEHRDKLRAAGRHLKRGILLHGPPGTGKTLTAMHLASRMPDRTVLILTGRGQGLLEASCAMARWLAPSTVILEDVDLVAEERSRRNGACNLPLLFELLNEMDGLADDADVLFLLTTNRPDILEPALASRPGRVDQAIEIPLPDETCRRRLLDLYGRGLQLQLSDVGAVVSRTHGVSAAFVRELLRKAALFAADEPGDVVVTDRHIEEAMRELVLDGGPLTKSLLGAGAIR